jgi:histone H3/H4
MAAKKSKKNAASGELIISKSRTKAAAKKSNVSSDFYGALDAAVRTLISKAEGRCEANGRKTLRPQDL